MKKISTIICIIIVIALGFSCRKASQESDEQSIQDAVNQYKQSLVKIEEMEKQLEQNKTLTDEELVKLKNLEEEYNTLLVRFNDYKRNYPETINEDIKMLSKENESYSNQVAILENKVATLNDKLGKQETSLSSSSSSSLSNSSSLNNSLSSSNSSSSSSATVYANGGGSKSNKYHSSPNAHKMSGAIPMSESEAKSKGYVACKRCY